MILWSYSFQNKLEFSLNNYNFWFSLQYLGEIIVLKVQFSGNYIKDLNLFIVISCNFV